MLEQAVCQLISAQILERRDDVESWFKEQMRQITPPLHLSLDLRDGGYKVASVDANLFPAGFNNICQRDRIEMVHYHRDYLNSHYGTLKTIALVPEDHTSHKFYWESLYELQKILELAGYQVIVASPQIDKSRGPVALHSASGRIISVFPLWMNGNEAFAGESRADLLLLNNDLSLAPHPIFEEIRCAIVPLPQLGWYRRQKIDHERAYKKICGAFCDLIDLDPWRIQLISEVADNVDFLASEGMEKVAQGVESVLNKIKKKYQEYQLDIDPFVMVKNNGGTYGRAVLSVKSPSELFELNRKQREKMSSGKGGVSVKSVIIQEGVPSIFRSDRAVAEPVIYVIGGNPAGAFIRAHGEMTERDNLNARGMTFQPVCLHNPDDSHPTLLRDPKIRLVYKTIARLSALAAGLEANALTGKV